MGVRQSHEIGTRCGRREGCQIPAARSPRPISWVSPPWYVARSLETYVPAIGNRAPRNSFRTPIVLFPAPRNSFLAPQNPNEIQRNPAKSSEQAKSKGFCHFGQKWSKIGAGLEQDWSKIGDFVEQDWSRFGENSNTFSTRPMAMKPKLVVDVCGPHGVGVKSGGVRHPCVCYVVSWDLSATSWVRCGACTPLGLFGIVCVPTIGSHSVQSMTVGGGANDAAPRGSPSGSFVDANQGGRSALRDFSFLAFV